MSIVVIIPFYNDFKALQRLLLSLASFGIPSIFCDGRFHNFKKINDSDLSTDGSRFLILGFKQTNLIDLGPCSSGEKLNRLFHEAAKLGFSNALLLGCDEYIEGDYDILEKNISSFNSSESLLFKLSFNDHSSNKKNITYIDRLFHLPAFIRTRGSLNIFYSSIDEIRGNKKSMISHPSPISGIIIHHDASIRDKQRNELMKEYQSQNQGTKR